MSQYQEMKDDFQESVPKESFERVMPDSMPMNLQMRKYFKTFGKKKTFDKLHSFVNWVEMKKPPQGKSFYNQVRDYQYSEDNVLVVQHEVEVSCVDISRLTQTVAVGLINGVVSLIHSKTSKLLAKVEADVNKVNCLILSDQYLYTGGNSADICMWNYVGQIEITKEYTFEGHSAIILCMIMIPKDKFLISGDALGVVFIWNIAEKNNRKLIASEGYAINALAVTPDASKIISAGDDYKIKFWNFADLTPLEVFEGHEERIITIAISPTGDRLASAGGDKVVKIWDMKEKKEKFSMEGHEEDVNCLAFLPNGKALASGSDDNSIKIWSSTKGLLKTNIEGHAGAIKCFAINQKNSYLISGSVDKTIRGWNLNQFKNTNVLAGSTAPVLALVAIPGTSYIISAGKERFMRVWSLEKAMKLEELDSNGTGILSLDVNSEGTKFLSGGLDGKITLWDIDLNNFLFTSETTAKTHLDGVSVLKFTRKGGNIVSGSLDQSIKIWDLTLNKELRELKKHPGIISAMAITYDDNQIITGSKFSGLYMWDFNTLKNVGNLQGHQGEITCIKVTSDYKLITSCQDCTIKIWNLMTKKLIRSLELHEKPVLSIEITQDNNRIISGSEDQTLRIWDLNKGEQIGIARNYTEPIRTMTIESGNYRVITNGNNDFNLKIVDINEIKTIKILGDYEKSLNVITLSPDQKFLVTGSENHRIRIWDLHSWKSYPELKGHVGTILDIKFTSDKKRMISCGSDNTARIWDVKNMDDIKCIKVFRNFSSSVSNVQLFEDDKKAVFSCYNNCLIFYDMEKYEYIDTKAVHYSRVICLALDKKDNILYSGSLDKRIMVFSLKEMKKKFELGQHNEKVTCLLLTPSYDRLISGSNDQTIKIWNLKEKKLINTIKGHTKAVMCLAINSSGSKLFSGSLDETIQIWDLNKYKRLAVLDGSSESINSIVINLKNTRLYSASSDKTVRVWDIDDSKQYPFCEGHFDEIRRMEATPDGKFMVSVSSDNNIIIWDIKEGRQKAKLTGNTWSVTALALTSDGSKIVTGTYNEDLRIWDLKKQMEISSISLGSSTWCLILSNDDKEIIVACCDSIIRIFDFGTLVLLRKFEEGHCSNVRRVILSPDGDKLVSASEDRLIIVWNYKTTEKLLVMEGHEDGIQSLAFIKGQDIKLLSGSSDKTLRVWNFKTGINEKVIEGFSGTLMDLIVTADNKRVIIGIEEKSIHIYDLNSYKEIKKFDNVNFTVNDILLTKDEKHFYAAGEKTIGIWNFTNGEFEKYLTGFSSKITREILLPNKRMICFATDDFVVKIWDFHKGLIMKHQTHTKEITALIVTSNNQILISASKDKTIVFFKVQDSSILLKLKGHSAPINALALSKAEDLLISASEDNTIKLWTFPNGDKKSEFKTGEDSILSIAIISDLHFLTGGIEKKIKLWNILTGTFQTVAITAEKIQGIMLSPDNHYMILILENKMMQIWDTYNYSLINQIEKRENITTYPVFLSQTNNRLMLYYEQLIDCMNGEIIFNFETNREMISFFFDYNTNSFFYITPEFELFKLHDYWLQTYIFQYLKYDSITTLNKNSEIFVKRPASTYPFFLSFLHLITIFEKTEFFTAETFEQIYAGKVELSYFFSLDIFMNTPLDLMILKKNTTLMMKYFKIFFEYFEKENASFFQKARFLNYHFREDYDILNLMSNIMELCTPDFSIVSKLLDLAFMPLDPSIYDNSLIFKELEESILISTDSLYMAGKGYIEENLKETLKKIGVIKEPNPNPKKEKGEIEEIEEIEENQSMVKAKLICLPNICDISNDNTERIFSTLADCEPDNEIFANKTLKLLAFYIWSSQIKYLYLTDFIVFFLFFALYNINFIYLYPLRVNIYYNEESILEVITSATSMIDILLFIYALFSLTNELRQMCASGFSGYFKSIWNYFDILLIPLLLLTAFSDILRSTTELSSDILLYIKLVSAICMFCFWCRFLSYFRAMTETSSMIRLILNVITSTRFFLLFMVIFMLALSSTFYLLHNDNQDENPVFWDTFLVFYSTTVGDTSGITDYDLEFSQLSNFFVIGSTFIFAIILLNLLVSIIGDIHGEIKDAGEKTRLYELINIIVDTNFALTTLIVRCFKKSENQKKYLIQLYNEKHEEKEVNVYEALEKKIEEKLKGVNKENERLFNENTENLEKLNGRMEKIEKLNETIEKMFENGWVKVKDYLEKEKKKN